MTRRNFLTGVGALGAGVALGTTKFMTVPDRVFDALLKKADANGWRTLPIGELIGRIALTFLDTPYVGQTLEVSDSTETCVINLEGLDCVTFFETSFGFARMLKAGGQSLDNLVRQVTQTRYRGGVLNGYLSRLHYTCEWISDNANRQTVENLSGKLPGATPFEKRIDFMSTHPESYRQLQADPRLVESIAKIEARLSTAAKFHVPRDRVAGVESHLLTGDIVGITTSIAGIDCSHTGLCLRHSDGSLRFLHASSAAKKVVLGPRLNAYVSGSSKNLGVMIARPLEPAPK